jgi:hypothetical protein
MQVDLHDAQDMLADLLGDLGAPVSTSLKERKFES